MSKLIAFRLTTEQYDKLTAHIKDNGLNMSDYIRRCILSGLGKKVPVKGLKQPKK